MDGEHREELEIPGPEEERRWGGLAATVIFGVVLAGVVVAVLVRFTTPVVLAVGVVAFMGAYMALAGWLAGR